MKWLNLWQSKSDKFSEHVVIELMQGHFHQRHLLTVLRNKYPKKSLLELNNSFRLAVRYYFAIILPDLEPIEKDYEISKLNEATYDALEYREHIGLAHDLAKLKQSSFMDRHIDLTNSIEAVKFELILARYEVNVDRISAIMNPQSDIEVKFQESVIECRLARFAYIDKLLESLVERYN